MALRLSELYPVGSVVWYKWRSWPWWPAKVEEVIELEKDGQKEIIHIRCFKTEDEHELCESASSLKSFDHEGVKDFVIKVKKSCYKRKSIYTDFCAALELAVEFLKVKTGNPEFSLGIDPYADVMTQNKSATSPRTISSQARFALHSCSSEKPAYREQSKSTSKIDKTDRNGHVVAAGSSPVLAYSPKPSSEDAKLKSGKRKRSVDSFGAENEEKRTSKMKKLIATTEVSKDEKCIEAIPRKLNFDDEAVAREGPTFSVIMDVPQPVRESPSHSIQGGPSHCIRNEPSSPSSRMEQQSPPCPESLSNGNSSMLPLLESKERPKVESSKEPVGGDTYKAGEEEELSHLAVERGAVSGLPCSRMSSESDENDVMFTESDEGFDGLSDDSDDDSLPVFSCIDQVKEEMTLKDLGPNSIIWVKFGKYPFWPALVVNVVRRGRGKRRALTPRVLYFGYSEANTTPVRNKKNIAPFATKRTEEFMEEGRKSKYREQFELAVDEARTCLEFRLKNDETTSTPRKLFQQVARLRPKEYTRKLYDCPMWTANTMDDDKRDEEAFGEEGSDGDEFLTGKNRRPFSVDSDNESRAGLDNSDDEAEDPVYSYDRVMSEVEQLRSVLMDITQGKLSSEFHKKFLGGSKKEQRQFKIAPKRGPLAKWSANKLTDLVQKLVQISKKASDGRMTISHAYGVLLPEFVIRLMMRFENLSEPEAAKRLEEIEND